jgi:hypothetical protein
MKTKYELNTVLSGVAGEYYVAAELSKRGYLASITLRNTKGVDVLCSNEDASKSVGIQVKTNKGSNRSWLMNQKAENYFADNLFYVFVNLNNGEKHPDYFIVPSTIASNFVKESHSIWLSKPGRGGKEHADTNMRVFSDKEEKYREKWDLLGL